MNKPPARKEDEASRIRSKRKAQPSEARNKCDKEDIQCRDAASYVLLDLEREKETVLKAGNGPLFWARM